jgi:hypothetical protein
MQSHIKAARTKKAGYLRTQVLKQWPGSLYNGVRRAAGRPGLPVRLAEMVGRHQAPHNILSSGGG